MAKITKTLAKYTITMPFDLVSEHFHEYETESERKAMEIAAIGDALAEAIKAIGGNNLHITTAIVMLRSCISRFINTDACDTLFAPRVSNPTDGGFLLEIETGLHIGEDVRCAVPLITLSHFHWTWSGRISQDSSKLISTEVVKSEVVGRGKVAVTTECTLYSGEIVQTERIVPNMAQRG